MNIVRLKDALRKDEDLRLKPYRCSAGKLTIGYGRNLDDVGINEVEAQAFLDEDISQVLRNQRIKDIISPLDGVRAEVIVNMAFNLGVPRLLGFKKMLAAVADKDYERAAEEMKDSRWYHQVKGRARRLVEEMRTGKVED